MITPHDIFYPINWKKKCMDHSVALEIRPLPLRAYNKTSNVQSNKNWYIAFRDMHTLRNVKKCPNLDQILVVLMSVEYTLMYIFGLYDRNGWIFNNYHQSLCVYMEYILVQWWIYNIHINLLRKLILNGRFPHFTVFPYIFSSIFIYNFKCALLFEYMLSNKNICVVFIYGVRWAHLNIRFDFRLCLATPALFKAIPCCYFYYIR